MVRSRRYTECWWSLLLIDRSVVLFRQHATYKYWDRFGFDTATVIVAGVDTAETTNRVGRARDC